MAQVADGQWHAAGLRLLPRVARLALSLPSLPFSPSRLGVGVGVGMGVVEGAAFGRRR